MRSVLCALLLASLAVSAAAAPTSSADDIARAWRLFDQGRGAEGQDILDGLVRDRPGDDAARRAFLIMASDRGEWSYARDRFREEYEKRRDGVSAYWYFAAESDPAAARAAVDAVRRGGGKSDAHLAAAAAAADAVDLVRGGRQEKALERLDASGLARFDPVGAATARASILLTTGRLDGAEAAALAAARLEPHEATNLGVRAQIRLMRGDADGYRELLGKALKLGNFAFAYVGLAYADALQGISEERDRDYRNALSAPRDGYGWECSVAEARAGLGQFWRASAQAEQVLQTDPRETCALGQRAGFLLKFGQLQQAQDEADAILKQNPRDLNALIVSANLLLRQGRNAEARRRVEAALALAPGAPELLIMEAQVLTRLGELDRAFEMLQQAQRTAQNYPRFHEASADLARARGDDGSLLFHAGQLATRGGDQYSSWKDVGDAQAGLGAPDRAAAAYARARRSAPDDAARKELDALIARAKAAEAQRLKDHPLDAAPRLAFRHVPVLAECRTAAFELASETDIGCPWGDAKAWRRVKSPGYYFYPLTWSVDGRTVYLAWPDAWTAMDAESGRLSQVLRNEPGGDAVAGAAVAGRAGKAYAVVRRQEPDGVESDALDEVDLATGARRRLTRLKQGRGLIYDPVSDRLFLFGGGNKVVDLKSGGIEPLPTIGCTLDLDVSPSGDRAVCVDARDPAGVLVLFDFKTKKRTLLGATGARPRWSPDGRTIAYVWRESEVRLYDVATGKVSVLWTGAEPDLEEPHQVSRDPEAPVWSSDSRYLYFQLRSLRAGEERTWLASFAADMKKREVWIVPDQFVNFAWAPVHP